MSVMAAVVLAIYFVILQTVPPLMAATVYLNEVAESDSADVTVTVTINTIKALSWVEDSFISYNMDSSEFGESFQKLNLRFLKKYRWSCRCNVFLIHYSC